MPSNNDERAVELETKIKQILMELERLQLLQTKLNTLNFTTNSDRVGLVSNVNVALRDRGHIDRKAKNLFRSRRCDNYINRLQRYYGKLSETVLPNIAIVRTHAKLLGVPV